MAHSVQFEKGRFEVGRFEERQFEKQHVGLRIGIVLALALFFVESPWAQAQPALDALENQVREDKDREGEIPDSPPLAEDGPGYFGVVADDRAEEGNGIRIVEVVEKGPAEAAGLRLGDLLVGINGRPIRRMDDLERVLLASHAGQTLRLEVERSSAEGAIEALDIEVTLAARPPKDERRFGEFGRIPDELSPAPDKRAKPSLLGIRMGPVTQAIRRSARLPAARGALVLEVTPNSPAAKAGIPKGAVIVAVDGAKIDVPADLARQIEKAGPGGEVTTAFYRDGKLFERKIQLADPKAAPDEGESNATSASPSAAELAARVLELEARVRALEEAIERLTADLSPAKE